MGYTCRTLRSISDSVGGNDTGRGPISWGDAIRTVSILTSQYVRHTPLTFSSDLPGIKIQIVPCLDLFCRLHKPVTGIDGGMNDLTCASIECGVGNLTPRCALNTSRSSPSSSLGSRASQSLCERYVSICIFIVELRFTIDVACRRLSPAHKIDCRRAS